jgi:hypothetical protein
VSEYVSARVFSGLVPQAMAAGIDYANVSRLSVMVSQEIEHAQLCARVVRTLGDDPSADFPPSSNLSVARHPPRRGIHDPLDQVYARGQNISSSAEKRSNQEIVAIVEKTEHGQSHARDGDGRRG